MKQRIYIAGPMTGLPDFNYPAFNAAAKLLRDMGHTVLNPAENPAPRCGTWSGYMRMALAQLVQVDCVVLLPGWAESRGALLERSVAQALGIDLAHFGNPREMATILADLNLLSQQMAVVDWSAA